MCTLNHVIGSPHTRLLMSDTYKLHGLHTVTVWHNPCSAVLSCGYNLLMYLVWVSTHVFLYRCTCIWMQNHCGRVRQYGHNIINQGSQRWTLVLHFKLYLRSTHNTTHHTNTNSANCSPWACKCRVSGLFMTFTLGPLSVYICRKTVLAGPLLPLGEIVCTNEEWLLANIVDIAGLLATDICTFAHTYTHSYTHTHSTYTHTHSTYTLHTLNIHTTHTQHTQHPTYTTHTQHTQLNPTHTTHTQHTQLTPNIHNSHPTYTTHT